MIPDPSTLRGYQLSAPIQFDAAGPLARPALAVPGDRVGGRIANHVSGPKGRSDPGLRRSDGAGRPG